MAGWLLLAVSLAGALLVYNVYRPTMAGQRVAAISFFLGWLEAELAKAYQKASPVFRITPTAPPFMVIHGASDTLAPVEEARLFAERLRATSRAPVVFAEIPGAQHAFELFPSLRSQIVRQGVDRFLAAIQSECRSDPRA